MHVPSSRRLSATLALATTGGVCAFLAVLDKLFGLVRHPLHLATAAYATLFALLALAYFRGIPRLRARPRRLSVYTAFLILNILTAAYVFAWRVSADPTPVLLQAQLRRGDELREQGEVGPAFQVYSQANRAYPNAFPVLWRLGLVQYEEQNFKGAEKFFERALAVAPPRERWRALYGLGRAAWSQNRPVEAVRYFEEAREGLPESEITEWHYRLAWAYFDAEDYDAAIEHYTAVTRAGGKFGPASYYNIACAQAQKVRNSSDPGERQRLVRAAVEHIRHAWETTTIPEDLDALRAALLGSEKERDPELEPLRASPEFRRLLQELRAS